VNLINNSYLVESGEVLGYCNIVPKIGEEHMFGDKTVYFAYQEDDKLFFGDHKSVNEDEEAEFIQTYLLKCGAAYVDVEDIKLILEAQTEYLMSVGIIEIIENINQK
jgi:hypothetical protein